MNKYAYIFIFLSFAFAQPVCWADAKFQLEQINNGESLPRVEIHETTTPVNEVKPLPIKKEAIIQKNKPAFNPKKNSGMTNYQYDDTYYKYNKYEKYIKDNIEYSKSGSTKLY